MQYACINTLSVLYNPSISLMLHHAGVGIFTSFERQTNVKFYTDGVTTTNSSFDAVCVLYLSIDTVHGVIAEFVTKLDEVCT